MNNNFYLFIFFLFFNEQLISQLINPKCNVRVIIHQAKNSGSMNKQNNFLFFFLNEQLISQLINPKCNVRVIIHQAKNSGSMNKQKQFFFLTSN